MKNLKKSLAFLLALLMALSTISMSAMAADRNTGQGTYAATEEQPDNPNPETEPDPEPEPEPEPYTGFIQENGTWQYYVNDVKSNLNSVVSGTVDGTEGMWYVLNGKAQLDFTGLCNYSDANGRWWYVENGLADTGHNSVDQNNYGWWYVVGGKVDFSYTGVSNYGNASGFWYVKDGKVDFSKNSVEQNNYGWWYVLGGKVQFGYTGVANYPNDYGWWYIKDGQVDFSCNSVECNDYGWWYVLGGKVDFSYTGIADYYNDYGLWYIKNGKVDFSENSVVENQAGWWYVDGGKVMTNYTGVANYANDYGWWYVKNGKVDFSKTGIEQNNYGWWRVVNGKVDFSCNSVEQNDYGWWYLLGGKVQFGYTGIANYANNYGWWYINGGKVDFSFTGLASNSYGTWYAKAGKVDFSFTGLYNSSQIKNGKRVRVYQNPSQYYQIQDSQITLSGGGYSVDTDFMGLKTAWVKKALGLGSYVGNNACVYNSTVKSAVKNFQSSHGLSATGVTDLATWKALGYTEDDWYTLGAYVSPIQVNANSTRSDCIEAMISRAYDYLGTSYVDGASGPPGTGVDCSGLAMQALFAAGIDMTPINPVRHAYPGYDYESANMWDSDKFKHVSYSERQRGDLIFYCNSSGTVRHVAIYLGNDQIIDSWGGSTNKVRTHSVSISGYNIKGVARPFV